MKILYDGQIYGQQFAGGINRYFANLIERLPNSYYPTLTTCHLRDLHYPQHQNLKTRFFKRFGFQPGRLCYWLEKQHFWAVENLGHFDLLHPTYYTLLTRRSLASSQLPIVLTVYDMIHEIFADRLDPTGEFAEIKRKAILSAQIVLCISESTKRDLLERIPIPEERVRVTPLATEIDANVADNTAKVPNAPYFLYVGGRPDYKNFDCVLKAFVKAKSKQVDLHLCVVGAPFNANEQQRIASLELEQHIENYGYVNDPQLAQLYRCSLAFVYPSLYEGFGIPLLEAMSCGTAVIAANNSSIPEVVGDAGLLFDSKNSDELTDRLLFIAENPIARKQLIQKGHHRTKRFSWDQTTTQTIAAYRTLVSC
jgi:glycosyltransferase involved in cell wall biosynthesis